MELRTERLVLREFSLADQDATHRYGSDVEVTRYMTWGPNSLSDTANYLMDVVRRANAKPRTSFTLAVVNLDGDLIGAAGLKLTDGERRQGELGYVLAKDSWGSGYATEVARCLIAFGFNELGLDQITAICDPENHASARVLEKAGMRFEGTLRDHLHVQGAWRDSQLYVLAAGSEDVDEAI
ncbi:MAG: GNAT family N-acetyltransferase [Acidimicrobiales bacterium]